MARHNKVGIDFYPMYVDFFQDDKIRLIEAEFGERGGYIAVRLLCKIYKEGYYYKWGSDECLLFTKEIGTVGVSIGIVNEVVMGLVKRGFFDKTVFNSFQILTSIIIQKNYFEATRRYKEVFVVKEYLLIDVDTSKFINVNISSINDNINSENADINQQKRREEMRRVIYIKEEKYYLTETLFFLFEKILSQEDYIENSSNNFKLDSTVFENYLKTFFVALENRGDINKPESEIKNHFANWLKLQLSKVTQPNYGTKDRNQKAGRNSSSKPIEKTPKDYSGEF